jgi:hypothetical protein
MKIITAFAVGLALIATLPAAPANAQAARTFVSPTGSDSNLCTLLAPCRFLQAALLQTNPGGEIAVLGTAGYNNGLTVTITQAVSIVNPGAFEAGIVVPSGGTGITINAGSSDAVSLRGLTISGGGNGNNGIDFTSGGSMVVADCTITNLVNDGIRFAPAAASELYVTHTRVSGTANGIDFIPAVQVGGPIYVRATLLQVEAIGNTNGIIFDNTNDPAGRPYATVADSVAANNSNIGIGYTTTIASPFTAILIRNTSVSNNGIGVSNNNPHMLFLLDHSSLSGNGTAVSGGDVYSYGNNSIDGNINAGSALISATLR